MGICIGIIIGLVVFNVALFWMINDLRDKMEDRNYELGQKYRELSIRVCDVELAKINIDCHVSQHDHANDHFSRCIRAITEYLGTELIHERRPDPVYIKPKEPMIEVLVCKKRK